MPLFEYICSECGHRFEKLVLSAKRAQEIQCPQCSSKSVNKALSTFGVSGGSSAALNSAANCSPAGG
jgi:putative FmdB family regulatory protein